jgi:hypothetical protein
MSMLIRRQQLTAVAAAAWCEKHVVLMSMRGGDGVRSKVARFCSHRVINIINIPGTQH